MKKLAITLVLNFISILLFSNSVDSLLVNKYFALADTWGTVRYLHPQAASNPAAWNNAFVEAVRDLDDTTTADEIIIRAEIMLNTLGDHHTFVSQDVEQEPKVEIANSLNIEKHIIYLRLHDFASIDSPQVDSLLQKTIELSKTEKGLIIDLRNFGTEWITIEPIFKRNKFIENLVQDTLPAPAHTYLSYSGFPCEKNPRSIYTKQSVSTNYTENLQGMRTVKEIPITVILNSMSNTPRDIITLSLNSKAQLIATEKYFYAQGYQDRNKFYRAFIQMNYWQVNQKLFSTYIHKFLDNNFTEKELSKVAKEIIKSKAKYELPSLNNISQRVPEYFENDSSYPAKEERILALAKLYSVTKYFNPHKKLMSLTPEENFKKIVPEIIAAKDSLDYSLALAMFLNNLNDSHCMIESDAFIKRFFSAGFPFELLKLKNKFYISELYDTQYAENNNLKLGDEVLTLNNKSLIDIFDYTNQYISCSNENKTNYYVANRMLNGNLEDSAILSIQRGKERVITSLNRVEYEELKILRKSQNDTIKILNNNIAYVNLDLLAKNAVKSMLVKIKGSKGVIFDMRGYPNGTFWELATYLTNERKVNMRINIPLVNYGTLNGNSDNFEMRDYYTEGKEKKINVPIVVLMNAKTQSQAEGTCSVIKEMTGATLIGEQTSGADGNVTTIKLPGNVYANFTGMDPQDPRGVSQQGIGLLPDIEVRPTLKGIKAGRDEVLEAAVEFLGEKIEK